MTDKELLELAKKCGYWSGETIEMNDIGLKMFADMVALERNKALAQEQEPVAWMWKDGSLTSDPDEADGTWTKLYTAPPNTEVAIAEAYRCGYEAGQSTEQERHDKALKAQSAAWEMLGVMKEREACAKREWIGLTDKEAADLYEGLYSKNQTVLEIIRSAEAKLKEKNT